MYFGVFRGLRSTTLKEAMQSIELPASHSPTANEKLLFDNKGSRYAKAVDHFAPLLDFASHSLR
jgi:hypothetical protein